MITAKIIQDSINSVGVRIATLELEYPRFIHSEFMTHRVFSRNAASSRAIPVEKMMEQVRDNPAKPVQWGLNQAGMQAGQEHCDTQACIDAWRWAAASAVESARTLHEMGLHKQIANRVLEPFQTMKTVVTATEWDNFFMLRDHKDAQPEIQVLAREMKVAMDASKPFQLKDGEWHVPYVDRCGDGSSSIVYMSQGKILTKEEALMVSASCCAQVSYRLLDSSLEKALFVYDKLVNSRPIHASPFEHQGQDVGMGKHQLSGNLRGFLQYRKTLEV
tara:strand:+ start:76 stop:900 length:825 start_codon:yes stop_codon:yes gene_type:complete